MHPIRLDILTPPKSDIAYDPAIMSFPTGFAISGVSFKIKGAVAGFTHAVTIIDH